MIRDPGPAYNLGYGVSSRGITRPNDSEQVGQRPESGMIAKALNGHPVMRFFAISAATIVGMGVAGAVVKSGGVRLLAKAEKLDKPWTTRAIDDLVKIRSQLDEWQGLQRVFEETGTDLPPKGRYFGTKLEGGIDTGRTQAKGSFWVTAEETKRAAEEGRPPPAMWAFENELQSRLIGSARRMPYELPGIYVAQKALLDPILGSNQNNEKVNWYNPVDVFTDFVNQSVKNMATMILPFEGANAGVTQGYRRFMSYGSDIVGPGLLTPVQKNVRTGALTLQALLGQVGADATDLFSKTLNLSSKSVGAVSAAITESRNSAINYHEALNTVKDTYNKTHGAGAYEALGVARKTQEFLGSRHELADLGPGPFKGMGTGLRAAVSRWREISASQSAYEKMMLYGPAKFQADFAGEALDIKTSHLGRIINPKMPFQTQGEALQATLGRGTHPIEELAGRIRDLSRGGPLNADGSRNKAWRSGEFHTTMLQDVYSRQLMNNLVRAGVPEEQAKRFLGEMATVAPPTFRESRDVSQRIAFGKPHLRSENPDDIYDVIRSRLTRRFGPDSADLISNRLSKAIVDTDKMFQDKNYRKLLNSRFENYWTTIEEKALPAYGDRIMKRIRAPYEDFSGRLTPAQENFVYRRSAQMTGLRMANDLGLPVSDTQVFDHLRKAGFADLNINQMKGFLMQKGAIAKPWTIGGRNIFGLKPLTVESALDRGLLNSGLYEERDIRKLVTNMAKKDPISPIGGYIMGGSWETATGKVIDLTSWKRGTSRTMDKLATNYHVPLIKLNPLELFGYSSRQELRNRSILQLIPSMSAQPFLGGGYSENTDFFLWMRAGMRGTKGNVLAFGAEGAAGRVSVQSLAGEFRAHSPIGGMAAKHMRLAIKDEGYLPPEEHVPTRLGKVAKRIMGEKNWAQYGDTVGKLEDRFRTAFSVSDHQQDSMWGYIGRWRNRKGDLSNPIAFAKLLEEGSIKTRQGIRTLEWYKRNDPVGLANAYDNFVKTQLHTSNLAPKLVSRITGGPFDDILTQDFKGAGAKLLPDGPIHIRDLKTPAQIEEAARITLRRDASLLGGGVGNEEAEAALRKAQGRLWGGLSGSSVPGFWDQTLPQGARAGTLQTRGDLLRSQYAKYLIERQGSISQGGLETEIPQLFSYLQRLESSGVLTSAEATESRAAILGIQADVHSAANYGVKKSTLQISLDNVAAMRTLGPVPEAKQTLAEIASGRLGPDMESRLARFTPALRRKFGMGEYQYQGVQYNPFGRTNAVLVPTFKTTFERNKLNAVKSVLGINTWSDPSSFSSASIVSSHLTERINRYFSTVGLGLDPTAFKGPLDFYARGIVGKRVLPLVAGGSALLAADRTLGGFTQPKDEYGNRVYSPFVLGKLGKLAMHAEAGLVGAVPGGMSYAEKKDQLEHGEVPIRAGRWWPLGNTPWKGGRVQYYRPSWYRRLQAGALYTDQTFGTPLEKLAFYNDFSPLRPLDPYRFERKHYHDRPYPVTGEYFTGPWGPLTSALNMTVGKVLKPPIRMHKKELEQGLGQYAPVGESGAYMPSVGGVSLSGLGTGELPEMDIPKGSGAYKVSTMGRGGFGSGKSRGRSRGGGGGYSGGGGGGGGSISTVSRALSFGNAQMAARGQSPNSLAGKSVAGQISNINQQYVSVAGSPSYGTVKGQGLMDPRIIASGKPIGRQSLEFQVSQLGYELQEMSGIYGFATGAVRRNLGIGTQDLSPEKPVLASAGRAYSSTRSFWDLNIGGAGDLPLPIEGNLSNIEFSEIARRFVPRERSDVQYVNPIKNDMGILYPWLPGNDYFNNFKQGDPYTTIPDGEMRLPGQGYERLHQLHSGREGKYGLVDQFKILGDVAPWSQEYRAMNLTIDSQPMTIAQRQIVEMTREQVQVKSQEHEFHPYQYKYINHNIMKENPVEFTIGSLAERFAHNDSFFNTKFLPVRTAQEDWERQNVYGATFPEWQRPIKNFLLPEANRATQENPISAGVQLSVIGGLFGANAEARTVAATIGGTVGVVSSLYGKGYEAVTGKRWIPKDRRRELALEEQTDILSYVRSMRLANLAKSQGNSEMQSQYLTQAQQTMYGADVYQGNLAQIANAIPKRKREHFRAMLSAPEQERKGILSTAGRLERRIYEAAWGMPVEKRPELDDYFSQHELPAPSWEGWNPDANMEQVKIKMGQSMGLDMSQMGYYPQQVREANLVNISYPSFGQRSGHMSTEAALRRLMSVHGVQGDVIPIATPYGGSGLSIDAGAY